ncbi:ATP-binding protein [Fusobacterium sp. PH5-44]|uniref:ATP-binding protein n=1 Tax=unclassified Fusobacterium TaxID=2648384 RepID=UPI003D1CA116
MMRDNEEKIAYFTENMIVNCELTGEEPMKKKGFFNKVLSFIKSKLEILTNIYYEEDYDGIIDKFVGDENIDVFDDHLDCFIGENKDDYKNRILFGSKEFLNVASTSLCEEYEESNFESINHGNMIFMEEQQNNDMNVSDRIKNIEKKPEISVDTRESHNEGHSKVREFSVKEELIEPYELLKSRVRKLTFKEMNNYLFDEDLVINLEKKKELGFINLDGFYTNLALLFSDQCDYSIKVNIYDGIKKEIIKEKKEFIGSILKQYIDVCNYINHLNCGKILFKGTESYVKRDYDPEKIKEILINAIIHRDYSENVATVINIFHNRIEFISYGEPTDNFDEELLSMGLVPTARNRKMIEIFNNLNLVNSCGSGIGRILDDVEHVDKTIIKVVKKGFLVSLNNRNYQTQERIKANKKLRIKKLSEIKKIKEELIISSKEKDEKIEKEIYNILYQNSFPEVVEVVPEIKYLVYQIDKVKNLSKDNSNEESYVGQNQQRLPFDKGDQIDNTRETASKSYNETLIQIDKVADKLDVNGQYIKIIKLANKKEYITRKDVEKKLKLKQSRVLSILKEMTEKGLLEKNGVGKSTYYKVIG